MSDKEEIETLSNKIGEVIIVSKPSPSVLIQSLSNCFIRGCVAAQIDEDHFAEIVVELATIYEDCKKQIHKKIYENADELMEKIKERRESRK